MSKRAPILCLAICLFMPLHLFSSPDGYCRVYLATYPRSGNHWARYLIEEASGIATSSVYRDDGHLPKKFPWGGYVASHGYEGRARYPRIEDSVLIKTHFPAFRTAHNQNLPYQHVIRIIRHPIDSLYSHYIFRLKRGYTNQSFKENLPNLIESWKTFQTYWDSREDVSTIYYEDMCKNPKISLGIMLDLLGYQYAREDINRAVRAYPPMYQSLQHLRHYSPDDLQLIDRNLSALMRQHGYSLTG